jgi:alcohol dehydrogenase (cytochrome c)
MTLSQGVRFFFVTIIILVLGSIGIIYLVQPIRWRAEILLDKATGGVQEVGWSDLFRMLKPGSDIYLEGLTKTHNPYLTIENPRHTRSDLEAGKKLFLENCGMCHGDEGRGGAGPNLYDHTYRKGRSDWALYQTITRGIPNTAMVGRNMPRDDVWRIVYFIQQTMVQSKTEKAAGHALTITPVTAAEIGAAADHPAEWLTYSGSYSAQRHSRLRQISRENVSHLQLQWIRQLPTSAEHVETTPIVRGSTMFITEPPNQTLALDALTGEVKWSFSRDLPVNLFLCCGPVNRGVAILGNRVYLGTLDAHLIALDADTGKVVWDVAVADSSKGYSITAAPVAVEDMILTGVGGGEYGIRGFVDAYDAASGHRRWRFYTIPEPGQAGSETWGPKSIKIGGAPTWLTGSFDPELRLLYWGVGNPSLNFYGGDRPGDNLYSNSVIALNVDTGKLQWYFQFTPHDSHDWDSVQIPVLVDAAIDGAPRKLMAWANRNGFYYLLDRTNGRFLTGTPFVKQTWADGLDSNGRPRVRPESVPSREGSLVYPSLNGATNWWSPTYDPDTQLFFVSAIDRGGIFYSWPDRPPDPTGARLGGFDTKVPNEDMTVAVKALELRTGQVRWQYTRQYSSPERKALSAMGGLLSTAGRLVFAGDGETFLALDADSGRELWHFDTGGNIAAAPITYEEAGRQYVAIAAGRGILTFALPPSAEQAKVRAKEQ